MKAIPSNVNKMLELGNTEADVVNCNKIQSNKATPIQPQHKIQAAEHDISFQSGLEESVDVIDGSDPDKNWYKVPEALGSAQYFQVG